MGSWHFTPVAFQILLSDRFLSLSGKNKIHLFYYRAFLPKRKSRGVIIIETKTSFPLSSLHWNGRGRSKACWRKTSGKNQTLELALNVLVCLRNSDLCLTKSSNLWAVAEKLVQISIAEGLGNAHQPGQIPQQHTLCQGTEAYLSFSRARNYCVRHQGSTPGGVRGFWGISIPDSICLCFVQGAETVSPSEAVSLLRRPQPSKQCQSWDEPKMLWKLAFYKNTGCSAERPRLNRISLTSRQAQRRNGDDATVEKVRQTDLSTPLCIFILVRGPRMRESLGLQCDFKRGDAVPGRTT